MTEPIHLTAEELIQAMQGDQAIIKKYPQFKPQQYLEFKQAICIDQVIIDQPVSINALMQFKYPILIMGGEFKHEFIILGGEFKQHFRIDGGEFKQGFIISGGEFKQGFRIYGGEFKQGFIILGGEFKTNFFIFGGTFKQDFIILGGQFKKNFIISGGQFKQDFDIFGGQFKKNFNIFGGQFKKNFNIFGGQFKKKFNIFGGEFLKITFQKHIAYNSFPILNTIEIAATISFDLLIENMTLNRLHLTGMITSAGIVRIKNQKLNDLLLDQFVNLGYFHLNKVNLIDEPSTFEERKWGDLDEEIQKEALAHISEDTISKESTLDSIFSFDAEERQYKELPQFYENPVNDSVFDQESQKDHKTKCPYHHFSIGKKKQKSSLQIENSDLGKMILTNFDFGSSDDITIANSNLSQLKFYGTSFPTATRIKTSSDKSEKDKKKIYEIFRDLSESQTKQKDTEKALHYKAIANDNLSKSLLKNGLLKNFSSIIALCIGKKISNHGQSWVRPLIWLVVSSSIFYTVLLWSLFPIVCSSNWNMFPVFLLPTHPIQLFEEQSYTGLAYSIDVISRVSNGFFIYHFIRASRKYLIK